MVFEQLTQQFQGSLEDWEALKQELEIELEQVRQQQKEVAKKIEQSQVEVNRLTKRNASITARLQQVQSQLESTPRAEIRMAYDAALEAFQRLFVMRGQLEKLQTEKELLDKYINLLATVRRWMEQGIAEAPGSAGSFTTLEMMIQAQESERQRLSRQMHDGPAQALSNFILQTEIAARLFDVDQGRAREELGMLKEAATTTFQQVRDFIFELRPMMLDDLGLVPTVKRYVEAINAQEEMEISVVVLGSERRLEPYLEVVLFRSIQELLRNAIRHSQATEVKVQLDLSEKEVKVSVDDNGKGFDVQAVESHGNMGLKLIKERVEMLGGFFEIDSVIGKGTRVSFWLPLEGQVA